MIAVCSLWLIAVSVGSVVLHNYVSTPGSQGKAAKHWLSTDSLSLASPLSTLIMVVHPQCPCTQASISELALIMARCQNKVKAYVLFVSPDNLPRSWAQSELWRRAKEMPGVFPIFDVNGLLSHRLNAATSGQTYVYDAEGRLSFSGGITNGRGHEGDNAGVDQIVACINERAKSSSYTAVFGCSLFSCRRVANKIQTVRTYKQ